MRVTALASVFVAALGAQAVAIPEAVPAAQPDRTLSARQTYTSTDPKWTDHQQFRDSLINRHNQYRGEHGVGGLTWNRTLSGFAAEYLNKKGNGLNQCPDFAHSGGPYGENLAIGYGTPTQAEVAWGEERKQYDFNKPGFSSATGHFTQMVWKDTKQLGCARKFCTSGNPYRGWYLVCEYYPRGNIIGQFDKQVLRGSYRQKKRDEELAPRVAEDEDEIAAPEDVEALSAEPLVFFQAA